MPGPSSPDTKHAAEIIKKVTGLVPLGIESWVSKITFVQDPLAFVGNIMSTIKYA